MGGLRTSAEEVGRIKALVEMGGTYKEVAKKFGRSPSFVSRLIGGHHELSGVAPVAPSPIFKTPEPKGHGPHEGKITAIWTILNLTTISAEEKVRILSLIV